MPTSQCEKKFIESWNLEVAIPENLRNKKMREHKIVIFHSFNNIFSSVFHDGLYRIKQNKIRVFHTHNNELLMRDD